MDCWTLVDKMGVVGREDLTTRSVSSHIVMGRKRTGVKPGRKTLFSDEEVEFLETFRDRFQPGEGTRNGVLYKEVAAGFIDKFGYSSLDPHNKQGITVGDLALDVVPANMSEEQRIKVLPLQATAQELI